MEEEDLVMVAGSGNLEPWAKAFPKAWVLPPGAPTPLPTEVRQKHTLGMDRIANAWAVIQGTCLGADTKGAWLIADAGTCLTLDLIENGMHRGGTISPGARMRVESMNSGTARLPIASLASVPQELRGPDAVGKETAEALSGGALGGMAAEIAGKWHVMRQEVPNLGLILTGGDAARLELRDIRPKFADAHLTLKGYHALFTHAQPHH